jgi:flagellar biosynthesis anti-sigma factor FlgM
MEVSRMTGLDGVSSLQKLVGALQVQGPSNTNSAAATQAPAQTSAVVTATTAAAAAVKASASLDHASFSAAGLASQSNDVTDVRSTKVAELRQAISNGNYNVPASAVADKIVDNLLK